MTNFVGTIFSCQAFTPLMIRNGGGSIVNFSSIASAINLQGESVYAASKAAVENFSKTFAAEIATYGIRVNVIAPGPIKTQLLNGVSKSQIESIIKRQILPREYLVSDIYDLVALLEDPRASAVTGQVINVGGVN